MKPSIVPEAKRTHSMTRTKHNLSQVYWIGGSPCSGKSTITDMLAKKHSWQVYHCDETFPEHMQRATPDEQPTLYKLKKKTVNEIFAGPVNDMVRDTISMFRERFLMLRDDLRAFSNETPILIEGADLLPECVVAHLTTSRHAIWVVPTETFQRDHYPKRGDWVQGVLSQCADPEQVFQNWMDRDVIFARWVTTEALRLGQTVLIVDGRRSIAENVAVVEHHFGIA